MIIFNIYCLAWLLILNTRDIYKYKETLLYKEKYIHNETLLYEKTQSVNFKIIISNNIIYTRYVIFLL